VDAPTIAQRFAMLPEAATDTPEACAVCLRLAISTRELDLANGRIVTDFGLESADGLVAAAVQFREAVAQFIAWETEVAAMQRSAGATVQ
jgi:hypothetical protein